jgi:serine/threonine-protein kinase
MWRKLYDSIRSLGSSKEAAPEEAEFDFLDSSAAEKLKQRCQAVFPAEQIDEFNHYTIVSELGRGNMGIVYKAVQQEEKQIYAIKVLSPKVMHNPYAAEQFFQEICIHSKLVHPNIIRLHKIGVSRESVFIVMEYVLGNDLDTWLRRQRLTERQALEIAVPIVQALVYADSLNIVHRDLKPANILIDDVSRQPKIADFGLAKIASEHRADDYSFGTPAYMSPEQVVSSRKVDIRADIYALGSILYHLLSGQRPYAEIIDPVMLVQAKLKHEPEDISRLAPEIATETQAILRKAMAREVAKRYHRPAEMLEELKSALVKAEQRLPPGYRKSPLRPSEQLHQEARQRITSFIPQMNASVSEVPELFMTATRYEIVAAADTFGKEVGAFAQTPIGSLLKGDDQAEVAEFEETLLTLSMEPAAVMRLPADIEKLLAHGKGKNLLDTMVNLPRFVSLTAQQRNFLSELKYHLVLRGSSLTKQKALIEFINEGTARVELKLDEMSHITQSSVFNKQIRKYLQDLLHSALQTYDQVFRQNFLACRNSDEVACYLQNYPVRSPGIVQKYRNLRIIAKVKEAQAAIEKDPARLERIVEREFAAHEKEYAKAFTGHYLKKGDDNTLLGVISRSPDLPTLMGHLARLQEKPEFKSMVARMVSLIEVFFDSCSHDSLNKLQTSLNFLPGNSREKVGQMVRARLMVELEQKVQEILINQEDKEKRFKNFLALLQNPRYHAPGLRLYSYPVKILGSKVGQVRYQKEPLAQVFNESMLPQEIVGLICEDQEMEIAARARTLDNCLRELCQLPKQIANKTPGTLLRLLLKIFNTYGKINLAEENSLCAIDGYALARLVVRFYNDPGRTTIELPDSLNSEIAAMVKTLVDEERARQLLKMER